MLEGRGQPRVLVREVFLPVPPSPDELAVVQAALNHVVGDGEQDRRLGSGIGGDPVVGVGRRVREAGVEDDELGPVLLCLDHPLGVGIEVVARLQMAAHEQDDPRVGVVGARPVDPHPVVVARPAPAAADVRVGVVAVDAPGAQHALGVSVLSRPAHVVHDLVGPSFRDRAADPVPEVIEDLVPAHPHPLALAPPPRAFERIEDAVGIRDLVERRRSFGAVPAPRARVLGVALELADLHRVPVDVRQEPARRLAVEAGGRDEHVSLLDARRPGFRVQFHPVVPSFFGRKGREVDPAGAGVEGLAPGLGRVAGRADQCVEPREVRHRHASGTACPAWT